MYPTKCNFFLCVFIALHGILRKKDADLDTRYYKIIYSFIMNCSTYKRAICRRLYFICKARSNFSITHLSDKKAKLIAIVKYFRGWNVLLSHNDDKVHQNSCVY